MNETLKVLENRRSCRNFKPDLVKKEDLDAIIKEVCKEKIERDRKRGIKNRPIRAMIVGIPNVGKSTFINSYAKKACTKVGNKPGVTKGKQWIRLNKSVELLDTPGILWPKFDDEQTGLNIAYIGSINDEILNLEELAVNLIDFMHEYYPGNVGERYGIEETGIPTAGMADALHQLVNYVAGAVAGLHNGQIAFGQTLFLNSLQIVLNLR